jgi:hypothetical protein
VAALATTDDLAAYLGHPPGNPAQATFMLDAASEFVRGYCRWSITRETDAVWTLDAAGGRLLAVPTLHLVSVSSVLVHGVERIGEIETSAAGLLYWRVGWPVGYRSVVVRAVHGHEQTPRDVLAVVCALASRMLTVPGIGPVTSHRIGSVQANYGPEGAETVGLTQTEQTALARHRLLGIAAAR